MTRARLPLVLASVAVVTLGLTACEKPNPGASVFSGTTSQFLRAACWATDGGYLDDGTCASAALEQAAKGASAVPTLPGQTIGISVDPVVADIGWFPVLGGQRLTETPLTTTYFRFTPTREQLPAGGATIAVVAGDDKGSRGIWIFPLITS
ncbi:MAG: hypothetical protein NTX29_07405 [Actinobacteria bacterium]|nr:hypothetical protein [Actinomycetota bacterium]